MLKEIKDILIKEVKNKNIEDITTITSNDDSTINIIFGENNFDQIKDELVKYINNYNILFVKVWENEFTIEFSEKIYFQW